MVFHSDHGGFVFLEVNMTIEQKARYEELEQLRDILK